MHRILCSAVAASSVALITLPTSSLAQVMTRQVKLTERQMQGFIAAQNDMSAVVRKVEDWESSDGARFEAELQAVAKKHGFKSLAQYDVVAGNISIVSAASDPQTSMFTDPGEAIENEIKDVAANKTVSNSDKKGLLKELAAAMRAAHSVWFQRNIALVQKYYDKLEVATVRVFANDDGSTLTLLRKRID